MSTDAEDTAREDREDARLATAGHREDTQRIFEGQRAINLIWESTQAQLAKGVVFFTVAVNGSVTMISVFLRVEITASQMIGLSFLNMVCSGVISFYFGRTNHASVGGVGPKSPGETIYTGR